MDSFITSMLVIITVAALIYWYNGKSAMIAQAGATLELAGDNVPVFDSAMSTLLGRITVGGRTRTDLAPVIRDLLCPDREGYPHLCYDVCVKEASAVVNLRDRLGLEGYLLLLERESNHEGYDTAILETLQNAGALESLRNACDKVLQQRWASLSQLPSDVCSEFVNDSGSYLYAKSLPPKVRAQKSNHGFRVNLLCSENDFRELIRRWENVVNL